MPVKLNLDSQRTTPLFQQIVDQIYFAISSGELAAGTSLPSIRAVAAQQGIAANTVAKAYRQLEFRGLIESRNRSGFRVSANVEDSRYRARGVSADKAEVHGAIRELQAGLFPGAFCKITEDFLGGDPNRCNLIHADGSGTKSIIAYLHYKETGDPAVFRGIAQDSIVMNLDDLLCAGANGRILLSSTINRNALHCPGEVISAVIDGTERFLAVLRSLGVQIISGGGETADVGDLTGTILVDSCAVTIMEKKHVITGEEIRPGLTIVGLSSTGRATWEDATNSGIGSNGLTSARHDLLCHDYALRFPESFDPEMEPRLAYCGPYRLQDPLPDGKDLTVGAALLSPTRTYAPVIHRLLAEAPGLVKGLIHCSGGGQTKCLRFGRGVHYIKDALFPVPPVFAAIQAASATPWREMYQVYNMGHRMEVLCTAADAQTVIDYATGFGIAAKVVGHTEDSPDKGNRLTLHRGAERFTYA